eukprot:TRINITY_DN56216_c0_g1_i1.p1 TRINITY_DN56216_c0_g1~~TRINITY_DN56216_c0_g1_i1.p1  ORF type:complete len:396 (+),score=126.02 TRINITY_DN56216_c0_g1_i1:84-1271(+)
MAAREEGLSELTVDGRPYWVDYCSEHDHLRVLLIDEDLQLWRGHAAMSTLRPAGLSAHSYLGLLRKALRGQAQGEHFHYSLAAGQTGQQRHVRLSVNFKLGLPHSGGGSASAEQGSAPPPPSSAPPGGAAGDIWLKGVDLTLFNAGDSKTLLGEFLRKQARAAAVARGQQQELRELEEERDRYKHCAERAAAERAVAEEGLLQAFLRVLNEKKRRLLELEQECERLRRDSQRSGPVSAPPPQQPPSPAAASPGAQRAGHAQGPAMQSPAAAAGPPPASPEGPAAAAAPPPAAAAGGSGSGSRPPESYPDFATLRPRAGAAARQGGEPEDAESNDSLFCSGPPRSAPRAASQGSGGSHGSRKRSPPPPPPNPPRRRRGPAPGAEITTQDMLLSDPE